MHRFHKNYLNHCFAGGEEKGFKRKVNERFMDENERLFAPKKRRKLVKGKTLNTQDKLMLNILGKKIKDSGNVRYIDQQLLAMKSIVGEYKDNNFDSRMKDYKTEFDEKNKMKETTYSREELEKISKAAEDIRQKIVKEQKKLAVKIDKYVKKRVLKEIVVGDSRSWVTPLVVPAKVVERGPYKIVLLSKNDVSRLDVFNTLCHIESCTRKLESVRVDADSNKEYILIQILEKDLNLIQIGWTTQLMCYPKTKRHLSVPNFPWIIRCLMDSDPDVYLQGLQCFVKLFVYLHNYQRYDEKVIETVKKLPQLLQKFGRDGCRYIWEAKFFEGSAEEMSPFLLALQTFLLPPLNYLTDCMYINANGLAILNDHLRRSMKYRKLNKNETALWTFVREAERHRCTKKMNWFKFALSKQELYSPFYNYILSASIDSNVALRLFFSVSNWRNVKKNSVQMKKSVYKKNMGALDQQYFQIPSGDQVSFHEPEIQMMRMIQLLELNSTQEVDNSSVGLMINERMNGGCGSHLWTTAYNLREKFIPFAQLPRGYPKSLPATQVFPIHKLNFASLKANKSDTGEIIEVVRTRKNVNKADVTTIRKKKRLDEEMLRTLEGSIRTLKELSTQIKTKFEGTIHYN